MKQLGTILALVIAMIMGTASLANAHITICSKTVSIATSVSGTLGVEADMKCPYDGHEQWIAANVIIQKGTSCWFSDFHCNWTNVGIWHRNRYPYSGYLPEGGGKSVKAFAIRTCHVGLFRGKAVMEVGGATGDHMTTIRTGYKHVSSCPDGNWV